MFPKFIKIWHFSDLKMLAMQLPGKVNNLMKQPENQSPVCAGPI